MTDKELQQLAREYVNQEDEYDLDLFEEIIIFLQWLSARYCIVEKEVVLKEYAATYPNDYDRGTENKLIECALVRIFGKELFTDTEQ